MGHIISLSRTGGKLPQLIGTHLLSGISTSLFQVPVDTNYSALGTWAQTLVLSTPIVPNDSSSQEAFSFLRNRHFQQRVVLRVFIFSDGQESNFENSAILLAKLAKGALRSICSVRKKCGKPAQRKRKTRRRNKLAEYY